MTELECPRCRTRTEFGTLAENTASFCPACDFPMFFVDKPVDYRRRLPGVSGMTGVAAKPCWFCAELNPAEDAQRCWRCDHDLTSPPPTPEPAGEDAGPPAPLAGVAEELEDEEPFNFDPWVVAGVVAALAFLILLAFLVLRGDTPAAEAASNRCEASPDAVVFAAGGGASVISGQITDRLTGAPVEAATVVVTGPKGDQVAVLPQSAGGAAGCYALQSLPPGIYTAAFSAPGYDATTRTFTIVDGDSRVELYVQLDVVETSVFGRVLTVAAPGEVEPVAGLTVVFDDLSNTATTDGSGLFVFDVRAAAGPHQLLFLGDFENPTAVVTIAEPGQPVAMGDIALVQAFTVAGVLVDSFGRPLSEVADPQITGVATVVATAIAGTNNPSHESTFAIGDGFTFTLPGPALYEFTVSVPETATQLVSTSVTQVLVQTDTANRELIVPFAPGVAWGVVASGGTPLPNATVAVVATPGADPIAAVQSDHLGRVSFGPLAGVEIVWLKIIDDGSTVTCSPDPELDPNSSTDFGVVDCTP